LNYSAMRAGWYPAAMQAMKNGVQFSYCDTPATDVNWSLMLFIPLCYWSV